MNTTQTRPIKLAPPKRSAPVKRRRSEDTAKVCPSCTRNLTICSYGVRSRAGQPRTSWCRECTADASKQGYEGNVQAVVKRSRASRKDIGARNRQWLMGLLASKTCADCGEHAPDIFEFDHRHDAKRASVSRMMSSGLSLATIQTEIDKCDILCPNCHRKRTHADVDSYLHRFAMGVAIENLFEGIDEWTSPSGSKNESIIRSNMRMRRRSRTQNLAWLLEHPCVDCGESDVRVLEYDHVRGVKASNVCTLIQNAASPVRIAAERDKCDMRCCNCHRRRSHNSREVLAGATPEPVVA